MEIRLVRILPKRMSELSCETLHASLVDIPSYTAISYAWGDGVDTTSLVLGTATVLVVVSLYDALKAVRLKNQGICALY
jgi:hypothetical protein